MILEKANLRPWAEKFKSGQHVVRMLRQQKELATPFLLESLFPSSQDRHAQPDVPFHFTLIPLGQAETDELINRAYDEAGYLMLTPWLASKMSCSVDQLLEKHRRAPLGGHVIPCSTDQRSNVNQEMFFNQVSFLYLCCAAGENVGEQGAKRFSRQFYEQIQSGMPGHLENAWKLARIIPATLFGRLLVGPLKHFAGTFSLAHVGAGLSGITSMAGRPVKNAFHMPIVPSAPGLGLFSNTFDGRLNLCLTSAKSVLNEVEHADLVVLLTGELLGQS